MHFDSRETKSAKECRGNSANLPAFPPKQRGRGADMWAGPRTGRAPSRGRSLNSGRDPKCGRASGEGGVASPPLLIFPPSVPPCYVSSRSRQAQRLRESRESGRRTQSGAPRLVRLYGCQRWAAFSELLLKLERGRVSVRTRIAGRRQV